MRRIKKRLNKPKNLLGLVIGVYLVGIVVGSISYAMSSTVAVSAGALAQSLGPTRLCALSIVVAYFFSFSLLGALMAFMSACFFGYIVGACSASLLSLGTVEGILAGIPFLAFSAPAVILLCSACASSSISMIRAFPELKGRNDFVKTSGTLITSTGVAVLFLFFSAVAELFLK
jgi:hypothetical protein